MVKVFAKYYLYMVFHISKHSQYFLLTEIINIYRITVIGKSEIFGDIKLKEIKYTTVYEF